MIGFLKDFISGKKTAEEEALLAVQAEERRHDILHLDTQGMEDDAEEDDLSSCATPRGGCCGGGCRS